MTFRPCIVVPVYNHAETAAKLMERLLPLELPVLLVNDGSSQDCASRLRDLAERHDQLDLMEHKINRGKGSAVMTGLRAANERGFTHALQIDADGQHDSNDIPRFLDLAAHHPESLITGWPVYDASVPFVRFVARYITHAWVWIETLSFAIPDSMCGFRVYPIRIVLLISEKVNLGNRMDFDTEIAVRLYWEGADVISVPTKVSYPEGGISHFRLWRDNCLISLMHARLFVGMIRRSPQLLRQNNRARAAG